MPILSVVIPLFNEAGLVEEIIERVKNNLEIITEDYEILIVDDGSTDSTWENILNYTLDKRIRGIKFSRNFGQHYAITAGLHKSVGEWVVVMDGDLQDRPEVIPELYRKAMTGFDIVFVSRQNRPEKMYYLITQKLFYVILKTLSGIDFDSRQANFSIISRKVVEEFKNFSENSRFYGSTIKWLGFKRSEIMADHGQRHSGIPSYTLKSRLKLATEVILSFSNRPLRFATALGLLLSISSIIIAIYLLVGTILWGYSVTGWASLIIALFFLSGIILSILGILGIYIGKIFDQTKDRPLYIISESTN
jgi:glycosyltransferase involved in cell wall biosynthesis